jgi:hypothetical protein
MLRGVDVGPEGGVTRPDRRVSFGRRAAATHGSMMRIRPLTYSKEPAGLKQLVVPGSFLIVVLMLLASSAVAEGKFQKLTGGQIRAKFAGMELTDEVHWYDFYDRNGTVMSSSMGRKRTGKWWIDRNQLCSDVDKESSVRCYDVLLSGNNVQLRGDGGLPLDAVLRPPTGRR